MSKLAQVIESMAEVFSVAELVCRLVLLGVADFSASLGTTIPFILWWRRNLPHALTHIAITFLMAHHTPLMFQILVIL